MNIVIADASPLIGLSRINKLDLLRCLFQQIVITNIVHDEIFAKPHNADQIAIRAAINAGWLTVQTIDMQGWQPLNTGVDVGEASAIWLAMQSSNNTLLIMDDRAGRAEARYRKIQIIGTAAVIGMAKIQGHISSAKTVLYALRKAGYYISESIIEVVLEDIGE